MRASAIVYRYAIQEQAAICIANRLLEEQPAGDPADWPEFAGWTPSQFEDYFWNLPTTTIDGGKEYALDYQNNFILAVSAAEPNYRFNDEIEMNRFLAYHEDDEDFEVDHSTHTYVSRREPDVPEYSLEQKRAHVVFEHGNYVFLKLPHDPDFIRREGISMQHCLSVAHRDYCERMIKGEIEVYSQTDIRDGQPKVDIEVALTKPSYNKAVAKPTVTQIRGPRNELPPKDEHLPSLMAFLEEYGGPRGWTLTGHGVTNFDGRTDGDAVMDRWKKIQASGASPRTMPEHFSARLAREILA